MKKLKLQVEEIHVEQFQVQSYAAPIRGTVRGLESQAGSCACGGVSDADTEPCRFCPDMPITYNC
jgi:hypothetical protein